MLPVDLVKRRIVARLTPEQVHRRHAGDPLLEIGVDTGDPDTHGPVGFADIPAEPLGDDDDQRQHREGHEREAPVHPDQHAHDPDQGEQVAEHRHDARREELVQHVDVGGHAGHQPAHGVAIVELQVQPLQMTNHLHPHVEHDSLAENLQRPGLEVLERKRACQCQQEHGRDQPQARQIPGRDIAINDQLRQVGRRELEDRMADDRRRRQADPSPVRIEVGQQTSHQTRVVRLADYFLVVRHDAASSSSSNCLRCSSA